MSNSNGMSRANVQYSGSQIVRDSFKCSCGSDLNMIGCTNPACENYWDVKCAFCYQNPFECSDEFKEELGKQTREDSAEKSGEGGSDN